MFILLFCILFFFLDQVVPGSHTTYMISAEENSAAEPVGSSSSQSPPQLPLPALSVLLAKDALPFPTAYPLPANTLHREVYSQDLWLLSTAMRKNIRTK